MPSELSQFEALRETIYSEVATLISQNENRPNFLIELFREMQLLNTDYLRQRALYAIQEVISRYLIVDEPKNSIKVVSKKIIIPENLTFNPVALVVTYLVITEKLIHLLRGDTTPEGEFLCKMNRY